MNHVFRNYNNNSNLPCVFIFSTETVYDVYWRYSSGKLIRPVYMYLLGAYYGCVNCILDGFNRLEMLFTFRSYGFEIIFFMRKLTYIHHTFVINFSTQCCNDRDHVSWQDFRQAHFSPHQLCTNNCCKNNILTVHSCLMAHGEEIHLPWSAQWPDLNPTEVTIRLIFVTLKKTESHRPKTSKQDRTVRILAAGVDHCVKRNITTSGKHAYIVLKTIIMSPHIRRGFKLIKHAWRVYIKFLMRKKV